ncbi:MAG: LapA family protein [Betaproteobacteria bacterium]|nr:LapA family protein [Betaproteobacteria bacterium]
MRYLTWFLRILLFVLLLGFAVKNTETVTLRYYFGFEWPGPLVLILLVFFAAGAGVGILACLGIIFRQRRQLSGLRRELRDSERARTQAEAGAYPKQGRL